MQATRLPFGEPGSKELDTAVENVVNGVALQAPDLDRLLAFFNHHASAFAQHLRRTNTPAAVPQNIRGKNHARRAAQVAGGYFLDESRHVDVRGTRKRTRCVKAIQAASRFHSGLALTQRRFNLREILLVLLGGKLGRCFAKGHHRASGTAERQWLQCRRAHSSIAATTIAPARAFYVLMVSID